MATKRTPKAAQSASSQEQATQNLALLQSTIIQALEKVKAQNVQVFDTEELSALFEQVIVASGTSNRQTKALAASVRDAVREAEFPKPRIEGEENGEWIIVDCGQVVVHVMQPAIRQYYQLEELWGEKPIELISKAAKHAAEKALKKEAASKNTSKAASKQTGKDSPVATKETVKATVKKAVKKIDKSLAQVEDQPAKKTAAKSGAMTTAKAPAKSVAKTLAKTPAKTPVKAAAKKTTSKPAAKAVAKTSAKTAAKASTKATAKAPAKSAKAKAA